MAHPPNRQSQVSGARLANAGIFVFCSPREYSIYAGCRRYLLLNRILFCVLMLSVTCSAQILQQLKKNVAFVYGQAHVKDQNGRTISVTGPLGTAFFVYYPDARGGENYGFTYIVTAKHILRDELEGKYLDRVRVRMNNKSGTGVSFAEVEVSDSNGNLKWFEDKDDINADIAILLALPSIDQVDYVTFPVSGFADADSLKKSNVTEGDSVYLVGLMPQFTGENRNYPVVRHGTIAMLADEPIPLSPTVKERVYALELGSWPGQSGSPVFLSLGGLRGGSMMLGEAYYLFGLMLAFVPNQRPFETVGPTTTGYIGDSSNIGISYVLPASEILKVLNSKEAQQQRDADIAAKAKAKSASVR